jgi:hypothetical protein
VPSTNIAQNHEGRGTVAPTLEDVWASSLLTNSVKAQIAYHLIHGFKSFVSVNPYFEPFRPRACQLRFSHS